MYKKYLTIVVFVMTASLKSADTTIQNIDAHFDLLVHKTPTCGCCKKWVDHMEDNGFSVITEDHQSLAMIKDDLKIQPKFRSCHTGVSQEGYFFLRDIFLVDMYFNFFQNRIQMQLGFLFRVCH